MGICREVCEGDLVVRFPGAGIPFVVRHLSRTDAYTLIGAALLSTWDLRRLRGSDLEALQLV